MTCSSCVHNIKSNLLRKAGILEVNIALTTSKGKVKYDPEVTGVRDVILHIDVSVLLLVILHRTTV